VTVYLNDGVTGGTTRFWAPDKKHFIDVDPKIGGVLVFHLRMLVHSGEEVTEYDEDRFHVRAGIDTDVRIVQ
jgi:hypothetical protein